MTWLKMILLSIIQGISEFLPISSSGHLVIAESLLDIQADQTDVNIVLHAGTLISILIFYRRTIYRLISQDFRVIPLLIVGTLPVVVIGLAAKKYAEPMLESTLLAGCMLPITGLFLLMIPRIPQKEKSYTEITYKQALIIGFAQAIAILPGISRSGSTIVTGLLTGLSRQSAATFSFLLAIPAITGATILETAEILSNPHMSTPLSLLAVGMVVSAIVGLAALWLLVRWLEKGKLQYFAYWCIPLGILITIMQLI
ncbi:MAG: undecaprenyl-diphosphate phosphatase [Planctomycetes bacterium]|nr:undecaprenyl-diphosphate phosphatase [Planctomycetota bacterium]MCH9724458.1 undecaprenyl-diphosphate phosphatase [Planctomycetota bacterium]MCH9778200.1 undecaprenyl-diphosphate phosphatase [Planctomycetota bacterium]MCH9791426.1 undecaprenyl-diphosphate phosphatase [Planctomycetota bacterium]